MKTPILGASYVARSINAADNRMVNLFPEVVPQGGKEPAFLLRAPGLRLLGAIGTGPIRGMWKHGEYLYVVSGTQLYKVSSTYSSTLIGTVAGTGPVSITDNGYVMFIAAGAYSYQYLLSGETISFNANINGTILNVFAVTTGTLYEGMEIFGTGVAAGTTIVSQTSGSPGGVGVYQVNISQSLTTPRNMTGVLPFLQITSPDFAGAQVVVYVDTYFIYMEPNSQRVYSIDTFDTNGNYIYPLIFDATNVASAEGSPDNLVSIIVDHNELWLFGTNSVEVWYDSGGIAFPFSRIQGAFNELGCAATFSVAKMENGLFWLGADARGRGMVYRANGYRGERISTHAVEYAIAQYAVISDAIAYTYQQEGHSFYVLTFPSANATWVFDASTNMWHERAGWESDHFVRHRSNCQAAFNDKIVLGDYYNGNIYCFDLDYYYDNGGTQRWLRSWRALPPGENTLLRTAHHSLQLDCETGVGLSGTYPPTLGANPQVMLRWSDDGGHTWSNERWADMGKIGQYFRRVLWRRLGMTMKIRDRVYEVSGTDPVKIAIIGAELKSSETTA